MYNFLFWDFDGTLFNTYPAMSQIFSNTLKEFGIDEKAEAIFSHMRIEYREAVNYYTKKYSLGPDFLKRLRDDSHENEDKGVVPFSYVPEILKKATDEGKKNFLFTHRNRSSLRYLEKFGLLQYFTDFATKENAYKRKPDPEALETLIKTHNIPKNEALMIGDRSIDIESAKNAGIAGCFFDNGSGNICCIADFTVKSIQEIEKIL